MLVLIINGVIVQRIIFFSIGNEAELVIAIRLTLAMNLEER